MIRTFHPIGQGAFYTEEFGAFSVVYDCGTDSKKSFLKAEIENVFENGQIIDAVFISHLHEDHVNGLKYLMEFCRVQRLFLPLLTEQEKIYLIISNYVNGDPDPFTEELINYSANHNNEKKPERLRNTKVVFVKPLRDNNNDMDVNNDDNSDTFLLDSSSNQTSSILSGTRLYSSRVPHWVYVPFNLESQERAIKLDVLLKNNNITPSDVETFKSLWADKATRKKIKELYGRIEGDLNTNSLVLYSGPENGNRSASYPPYSLLAFFLSRLGLNGINDFPKGGCLYLGDYDAHGQGSWSKLNSHYSSYWPCIGIVQIPHHGSRHNYNPELNSNRCLFSVISAGYSNRHRHPHASVLRDIVVKGGMPIIVNEHSSSRAAFVTEFY